LYRADEHRLARRLILRAVITNPAGYDAKGKKNSKKAPAALGGLAEIREVNGFSRLEFPKKYTCGASRI
jgi:hypothetical protein